MTPTARHIKKAQEITSPWHRYCHADGQGDECLLNRDVAQALADECERAAHIAGRIASLIRAEVTHDSIVGP